MSLWTLIVSRALSDDMKVARKTRCVLDQADLDRADLVQADLD